MTDIILIATMVAFFAAAALLVRVIDRTIVSTAGDAGAGDAGAGDAGAGDAAGKEPEPGRRE